MRDAPSRSVRPPTENPDLWYASMNFVPLEFDGMPPFYIDSETGRLLREPREDLSCAESTPKTS